MIWIGYAVLFVAIMAREWRRLAWVRRHFWVQLTGWVFAGFLFGLVGRGLGIVAVWIGVFAAAKCALGIVSVLRRDNVL